MGGIHNRQQQPAPGVDYAEIHLPNDKDLGTGSYIAGIRPKALSSGEPIICAIINAPVFQLSLNINPATREIPVLLGRVDNTPPMSRKVFLLPVSCDSSQGHVFEAVFSGWRVEQLRMDGLCLEERGGSGTITFWFDPAKNPGAFCKGGNFHWGTFVVHADVCTIRSEETQLMAILNEGKESQTVIFSAAMDVDPRKKHMVAVTWSKEKLALYFDGEPLETLELPGHLS